MTYTLTVSSQGQIIIPSKARKIMGIKPGSQLKLTIDKTSPLPAATLNVQPADWLKVVTGLGKGLWGKGEEYIEKERQTWDK